MTKQSTLTDEDIRTHLAETGRLAVIWNVEDVKSVRPELTEAQCLEVLDACERKHDANIGINWTVIVTHAEWLFPEADSDAG
jgi:hypothetical protein